MSDKIEKLQKNIEGLEGVVFTLDSDLTKYSTMKLKSTGHLITVEKISSLEKLITYLSNNQLPYQIIGWGANTILPEKLDTILVKLKFPFDKNDITPDKKEYELAASAPLNVLTSLAVKFSLKGWEVFTGVPGSLGGAIFMNAGTSLGEIGELITEVKLMDSQGKQRVHKIGEGDFSYRHNHFVNDGEIILSAKIKHLGIDPSVSQVIKDYLEMRMRSQPLKEKTCGCMFKNRKIDDSMGQMTCRAGLYIDIMGLGGFGLSDDLRISPKHANFMENKNGAERGDVVKLIDFTLKELEIQYGIKFEKEVQIPH